MTTATLEQSSLSAHEGMYLGFSPTDESAVVMGEIEMIIARDAISIRMATGLKIQAESMKADDFVPMTEQEIAAEYNPGSDAPAQLVGFRTNHGNPKLLLMKDKSAEGPGLIVRTGGMGEMLGPTLLFNPVQVARGDFDKAVAELEQHAGKGVLPRIRNSGRAER